MKLLKLVLPSPDLDALLGDITEEARHRSRLWYWTQILAVLVVGSWRDIRQYPLLAARATAVGVLMLTAYFSLVTAAVRLLTVLSNGGYYIGGHWFTLPARPIPEGYDLPVVFLVDVIGFAASGWAVTRLHRGHGLAMVMPYLGIVKVLSLVLLTVIVTDGGPGTRTLPLAKLVGLVVTLFASIPGGVVLGALVGLRTGRRRARTSP